MEMTDFNVTKVLIHRTEAGRH